MCIIMKATWFNLSTSCIAETLNFSSRKAGKQSFNYQLLTIQCFITDINSNALHVSLHSFFTNLVNIPAFTTHFTIRSITILCIRFDIAYHLFYVSNEFMKPPMKPAPLQFPHNMSFFPLQQNQPFCFDHYMCSYDKLKKYNLYLFHYYYYYYYRLIILFILKQLRQWVLQ